MITLEDIRDNLIQAIKESGINQTELATKISIRQQTISQYLNGRAMPALDTFANLCIVLDVDSNEILGITSYEKITRVENNLSEQDKKFINAFRKLTREEQIRTIGYMEGLYLNRNNQAF